MTGHICRLFETYFPKYIMGSYLFFNFVFVIDLLKQQRTIQYICNWVNEIINLIIFETGLDLKIFVIPLLLRVTSGVPKSILWTKIFLSCSIPDSLINLLILIRKGSRFPHLRKRSGRYWDGRGGKNYGNGQTGGLRKCDSLWENVR